MCEPLDENKALVRRYFEDARYNPDLCDLIFAPRVHFHTLQHATTFPNRGRQDRRGI